LEGEADGVSQQGLLLGVGPGLVADDRVGDIGLQGLFVMRLARAQHVEAHPGDDRGQPAAEVLDVVRASPADPFPGVLDGVVGRPVAGHWLAALDLFR
jgi:hypothetical protein